MYKNVLVASQFYLDSESISWPGVLNVEEQADLLIRDMQRVLFIRSSDCHPCRFTVRAVKEVLIQRFVKRLIHRI